MRILPLFGFFIILFGCKQTDTSLTAQQIIDKTIENAGGEKYDNAKIHFSFRDVKYSSQRENGEFEFTRTITDSLGETHDVLTNTSFERFANGTKLTLADSTISKYTNALNSVHYFVQLPYGLNAASVEKELVGEAEINGKNYFEIEVTFAKEGGGVDHEDVYMYWISKDDFTVDYFAYKFHTGMGGIRFRKAYNPRMVKGLRFVDYENYKVEPWETVDMQTIDELFKAGELELLSEIITEDVSVVVPKIVPQ